VRLDSHQHFWNYDPAEYGWTGGPDSPISRSFSPEDLKPLLKAHGYEGAIAVQVRQSLEENDYLLGLADRYDIVKGVVGWVDLCAPDVADSLEKYAAHPKFVGVRHIVQGEPDDAFMLRDDFQRGIAELARYALTYDILIYHRHLPYAVELVKCFPNQRFVLDHIAKPDIKHGVVLPWMEHIQELAAYENVWCKLSGMVTEADWNGWRKEDFAPYLETVFDAFGPNRVMIGSDWPVCTLSADYGRTMELVTEFVKDWDESDRGRLLGGNCASFYGIDGGTETSSSR
jgi:L-fuconolactonase